MQETLGQVIRLARKEGLGLTREQFTPLVGVTLMTAYYWERGSRAPRCDTFVKLLGIVPPEFALRMLNAAGMPNPEAWAMRLHDTIHSSAVPSDIDEEV